MNSVIYIMCGVTSGLCAYMLGCSFLRTRLRLLMWASVSFSIFAVSNVLLYLDLAVLPDVDLSLLRALTSLIAVLVLLVGMIWETV